DSITSFLNIALEHNDDTAARGYRDRLVRLNEDLATKQAHRDEIVNKIKAQQLIIDGVEGPYTKAAAKFKNINDRFDTQVKLVRTKQWTIWDSVRSMWIIDGFASPTKIHQFTIDDIKIDYNFKYVTRFDRCMSCHVGIDRPSFSRDNLIALTKEGSHKSKL